MMQLREKIAFEPGCFYRVLRWYESDRCVEIIRGPGRLQRLPAHGAHWHYHRAIEITFNLHGSSSCFVADRLLHFGPGDIFALGENVPHYWRHARGATGISIQWELPEEHGVWEFNEWKPLRLLAERARHGLIVRGAAASLATRQMMKLVECSGLERLSVLLAVMHGLLHAGQDASLMAERPFDLTGVDAHEEAIQRVRSYIHANHREPIGLAELLRVAGMSRTTFIRQFQRHAGCCSSAYLNRVRLAAVCHELRTGTKPVGTIALEQGFTQLSYFNRLFRRSLGLAPSAYRRQPAAAPRVA